MRAEKSGARVMSATGRGAVALVVVALMLLAGCGAATSPASTPSAMPLGSESPTVQRGPTAFIAWARTSRMGNKDMPAATDKQLLDLGNSACEVIRTSPSFGRAVADVAKAVEGTGATNGQIEDLVRHAVEHLCPQYQELVP